MLLSQFKAEYYETKLTHVATTDEQFQAVVKRMQICQAYLYNAPQDINYVLIQQTYNRLTIVKDKLIQDLYLQLENEIDTY
jgi:hypothetical protein